MNLTLKRLIKALRSIAYSDEDIGEGFRNPETGEYRDVAILTGQDAREHLQCNSDWYVSVEGSSLFSTLNPYYSNTPKVAEKALEKFMIQLDKYNCYFEWYNSCEFHIYSS